MPFGSAVTARTTRDSWGGKTEDRAEAKTALQDPLGG